MAYATNQSCVDGAASRAEGANLTVVLGGMPKPMWWADYACGCTSTGVTRRRDMPPNCSAHGGRMTTYHHGLPPNMEVTGA